MVEHLRVTKAVPVAFLAFLSVLVIAFPARLLYIKSHSPAFLSSLSVPVNWDKSYSEVEEEYAEQFVYDEVDWETTEPDAFSQEFAALEIPAEIPSTEFSFSADDYASVETKNQTASDQELALMPENDAWNYVTNGIWAEYPTGSFNANRDKLEELRNTNTETITVRVWYWANPKDDTDMRKITETKTFAVNSKLARTFEHIFEDIYNDPTRPIVNIGDGAMGTWVLRGKNHNNSKTMSAHSLGVAIDINPSTGSFNVNGTWYGNAYGQKAMPEVVWRELPECHDKYHVLYNGSPIVEIFKSYGFYWGGDWKSGTDSMHLSYLGDGKAARETGIANYKERQ